jgi:hypothetical protein
MKMIFNHEQFAKIIRTMPEREPFLSGKTDGFKYLHEKVFIPLLDYRETPDSDEDCKIEADVSRFSFDDLVEFAEFLFSKTDNSNNSPVMLLDSIFSRLMPQQKAVAFI